MAGGKVTGTEQFRFDNREFQNRQQQQRQFQPTVAVMSEPVRSLPPASPVRVPPPRSPVMTGIVASMSPAPKVLRPAVATPAVQAR